MTHLRSETQNFADVVLANDQTLNCFIEHRPIKGKPVVVRENLKIDSKGTISKLEFAAKPIKTTSIEIEVKDEREALNKLTTFNLGLKDQEREAREKIVLPFWKEEQKKAATELAEVEEESVRINPKSNSTVSGAIFYEPDEADDWDEEDPDDDLDF